MRVEQFIDRLEQRGLLDKDVISELRRKIVKAKSHKITPEAIAKYLVDRGHLTPFQATKLVSELSALPDAGMESRSPGKIDELQLASSDDDLASVRETRDATKPLGRPAPIPREDDEVAKLTAIDDTPTARAAVPPRPRPAEDLPRAPAAERSAAPPRSAAQPPQIPPAPPRSPAAPRRAAPQLDDLLADWESGAAVGGAGGRPAGGLPRGLPRTSEWDSMLLLVGGASLGVLLVIGAFLYLSLTRGAAEEMFAAAEAAYQDQSYSLAIRLYDSFLDAHAQHDKSSAARVRRELARLRQVYRNPEQAIKVALDILPQIEQEESFPQARDELASMLPQIARGFVDQARLAEDLAVKESLLAQTEDAMELVNNPVYIPTTLRKSQVTTIEAIVEDMARVRRDIDRVQLLNDTVATINASVASGNTAAAYEARLALLQKYPGLDADEQLQEAVLKISEKERERVIVSLEAITPQTEGPSLSRIPHVVLAHRAGRPLAAVLGHVVYTLAGGSVFALDASTGDVLWRRFVGFDTIMQPQSISGGTAGADALVVDQRRQEVMRLDAKSGGEVWRWVVGEDFREPVIIGERIYVAGQSGTLYEVDAATGNSHRQVRIPQPLEAAVGYGVGRPRLYQVAEQDNLYVLSADTLECEEVYYLGHKRGTITVGPVMALGYLFIVENAGPDFSYLHVIGTDEHGLQLQAAQTKIRLRGQVHVPPLAAQRRVLIVTDRRAVELYDVDPNNEAGTPVTTAGRLNATAEAPLISYPLLDAGFMWVANNRLTKYQVQASTGKLPTEWVQDEQDVYVAPLQLVRDVVIHVRQRQASPGLTVAAVRVNEREPAWQTEIAVPPRGLFVAGDRFDVVTARGRLFRVTEADVQRVVVPEALATAVRDERLVLSLSAALELSDGQRVLSPRAGYSQLVLYQPSRPDELLRLLTLGVPPGEATMEPVVYAGGLLVPLRGGSVVLADPASGGERARPFHPAVPTGTDTTWTRPAVYVAGDQQEFVIANNHRFLYRVGWKDTPVPQLAELSSSVLEGDLAGPLAVVDNVCWGVLRSASEDTLLSFALPNATISQRRSLAGRLLWGPQRVGDDVWLVTEQELVCLGNDDQPRWATPWDHGPVTGQALTLGSQVYLATRGGVVWQVAAADGSFVSVADIGEPLASGPVAYGERLLVAGESGTVFVATPLHP